jgi:hypothetical protein
VADDFTYALDGTDPAAVLISVSVNTEIKTFLLLEGGAVKLAAAQAIDTNADDQALASKVLRTQDLTTDGAKLAQVMHARAEQLRNQHANALEDGGAFVVVEYGNGCRPEHTNYSSGF